jgi:hypothetical protein
MTQPEKVAKTIARSDKKGKSKFQKRDSTEQVFFSVASMPES